MANKGIRNIPLFDPFFEKMSCPLFGVPTVSESGLPGRNSKSRRKVGVSRFHSYEHSNKVEIMGL